MIAAWKQAAGKAGKEELAEEIAAFPGVEKVTCYDRLSVQYEYNNYQTNDSVMLFESSCIEALNKARMEGEAFDYAKMVSRKEIIFSIYCRVCAYKSDKHPGIEHFIPQAGICNALFYWYEQWAA